MTGNKASKANSEASSSALATFAQSDGRTLYFHTGTHKTGSTALQAFFSGNQALFEDRGISYEFAEDADRNAGNGRHLFDELFDRRLSDDAIDLLITLYIGGRNVGICSSEDFSSFREGEWEQILAACKRLNVRPLAITYVRDIAPYYLSMHSERIKGGGEHCDFKSFCEEDRYRPVVESLHYLLSMFGRDALTVIHYDTVIDRIELPVMAALRESGDQYDRSMLEKPLNRSLTTYEKAILARVCKAIGAQFTAELSIHMLRSQPNVKSDTIVETAEINLLQARHSEDIAWINETFFDNCTTLTLINEHSKSAFDGKGASLDRQAIDRDVADWCISRLETIQSSSLEFITAQLRSIDWKKSRSPSIPRDFDPIAYLLLNTDVLKAGIPPFEHFIVSGQHEKGRRWKWQTR
jgi:hypothetical protein